MDGVIIDSEPMHYDVNQEIFKELGFNISDTEYNSYIGVSNTEMWTLIKQNHKTAKTVEELTEKLINKNIEHLKNTQVDPISGVVSLMKELDKCNIKIALASSSPMKLIDLVVNKFSIKKYFNLIESGENVAEGKPAPDLFLKVADDMDITPEDIVVIEDSYNGVMAAKKAGMNCVGYKNLNSGDQDLSQADLVVDDLQTLSYNQLKQLF